MQPTPDQIAELERAIADAATKAWGPGRTFEARFIPEVGAVELQQVLHVVDVVTNAASEVPVARVGELGFESGDEMLVQVFYRDEDASAARASCAETPELPSFEVIAKGLPCPEEPSWLHELWPVRRLRFRWGEPLTMPSFPSALDRIERWLTDNAPASVVATLTPGPLEELALLRALGPAASDLGALYARFGGACGTLEIFGAAFIAPSRARGVAELMTRLAQDPAFGRWDASWIPFLSWEEETYAVDCAAGANTQVVRWVRDTGARTIEAPSFAAWVGLLATAAEAGLLEWRDGIARDIVLFQEIRAALLPGYPRPLT